MNSSANDIRNAVLASLAVLALYLTTASGHFYSIDDHTHFETAKAWLERGELAVEPPADRGLNLTQGPDGRHYPYYGLGTALLFVPFLLPLRALEPWIGSWHYLEHAVVTLLNPLLLALAAGVSVQLARRLGASGTAALASALLFAIGSLAWPWSRTVATSVTAGAFLLLILPLLDAERSPAKTLLAGCLTGLLVNIRYETVLLLPGLMAWRRALGRGSWPRFLAFFMLGFLPWIIAAAWYNQARFGSPFNTGYADLQDESVLSIGPHLFDGLYGLLLSPGRGLFVFSAASLIALIGWLTRLKRDSRLLLPAALLFLPPLALYASSSVWHSGPSWGSRYLGLLLPLLHLGAAFLLEHWNRLSRIGRAAIIALVIVSLATQALGVIVNVDSLHDQLTESGIDPVRSAHEPNLSPLLLAVRYLPELTLEPLDAPPGRGALVGGGYPATQNLRRTPDIWVFYAYKLGLPAIPLFALWGAMIVMTVILWRRVIMKIGEGDGAPS